MEHPLTRLRRSRPSSRLVAGAALLAVGAIGAGQVWVMRRSGLHWDQEMALFPWLLRRGWVLYRDLKDQHPPLLPALLALTPDPGGAAPELILTLGLILLTTLLVALLAARLRGPGAAVGAAGLYALWLFTLGDAHLWYDLALGPCYLGAALLAGGAAPWAGRRAVALGLLLGAAALIKQQAALPLLAGLALVPGPTVRLRGAYLAAAAALPLASLLVFAGLGALPDYLYWAGLYNLTSTYAVTGAAPVPPAEWPWLALLYAPAGAAALLWLARRLQGHAASVRRSLFGAALLIAASAPAWPRYARFHLAAALPLLAVAAAVAVIDLARLARGLNRRAAAPWLLAAALLLIALPAGALTGLRAGRDFWRAGRAPLPYSGSIAPLQAWIAATTRPDEPILVYDLDPTLYRALDRAPPRPWTPLFPWIMEGDDTTEAWLAGLTAARPRVALVTPEFVAGRRLPLPDNGRADAFLRANYEPGPRFKVQKYAAAGTTEVVALRLRRP
jgi:hypothetical protein